MYKQKHTGAKVLVRIAVVLLVITMALAIPAVTAPKANATSAQAVVYMPFSGQWAYNATVHPPYTDDNSSHPSVHWTNAATQYLWGDWATDIYPPNSISDPGGEAVNLNVTSPDGTVTFTFNRYNDTCGPGVAGQGIVLNVLVNGVVVGLVDYEHLDNISSGPYTNSMQIGTITKESLVANCYTVRHIHMELKNVGSTHACWADHGYPGTNVTQSDALGVVGSPNTAIRQACASVPLSSGPSSSSGKVAAISFNGALNVFVRGSDGQLYTEYWSGSSWSGWSSLGANFASNPAVIINGTALNVFVRGVDNQIYTEYNDGSGWSGWSSLGSHQMKGNPTVMHYGSELDVFALDTNNVPYKATWNSANGWGSGWSSLDNYMASDLVAVQYGSNLDVFARGGDNVPYEDTWNGNNWSGWYSLTGGVTGNPSVSYYSPPNEIDIWFNTSGGHLYKNTYNGSRWGGWTEMGGTFAGDPYIMQFNNDMEVYARASGDGTIWTRYWSNSGQFWSGWAQLAGAAYLGDPTAIQYGAELDVFAIGSDGHVYKNTWNASGWGGFTALV